MNFACLDLSLCTLTFTFRYKIVLLLGFFLFVVWASTGKKEIEEEMESPPLPEKHHMPEKVKEGKKDFLDFDYKYDRKKSEKGRDDAGSARLCQPTCLHHSPGRG